MHFTHTAAVGSRVVLSVTHGFEWWHIVVAVWLPLHPRRNVDDNDDDDKLDESFTFLSHSAV